MHEEFPDLQNDGLELISPITVEYNCVAWAADDNTNWWEPDQFGLKYWPPNVPRDYSISSFVTVFLTLGYVACNTENHEKGQEKICIYASSDDEFTHVAWQMEDGRWSSKLGECHDIIHNTVGGLQGEVYGTAKIFMKRRRKKRVSM